MVADQAAGFCDVRRGKGEKECEICWALPTDGVVERLRRDGMKTGRAAIG